MLSRSLFVHSQTQLPKDRAWLEQVLCLVGLQAESEERGLAENASAEWRTDRLIGDVRAAADALEEGSYIYFFFLLSSSTPAIVGLETDR